jgi:hypothetical protein
MPYGTIGQLFADIHDLSGCYARHVRNEHVHDFFRIPATAQPMLFIEIAVVVIATPGGLTRVMVN